MKIRKGVFIVCYRKEGEKILYLILKRKLHWKGWEFVKGGLEPEESIKKVGVRELKEETGQHPVKLKKYPVTGKYFYGRKFKDRPGIKYQTYALYSAQLKNGKIKIDKKEHSSSKWVGYKKALKLLTWPNQRRCLRIVDARLKNA